MTFKQFKDTVEHFRNDVIVSPHGAYCPNKSKNTLGVIFIDKHGRHSRVYDYHGTYEQVLHSLGITEYYTTQDVKNYERQIEILENEKYDIFGEKVDNTEEIKVLKKRLEHIKTLYKAC